MSKATRFKVRRADESDSAAIIELRRALMTETSFMLLEPGEFQESAEEEAKRIGRLNARDNCLMLLAEEDSHPIGTLTAYGGETRRMRHRATLAVGVAKAHWGKGVATALLEYALRWSREMRLRRIELTVHTTNERAIAAYKRCGFQVEGVRQSSLLVDGKYVDEYLMAVINDV
jgi:RimJ/RimL family protein N-acetyltransferase